MSPSAWIAAGLVALAALGLWLVLRKGGTDTKDEVDAEAPRNVEKGRQHSEAEAAKAAPLSSADDAEVAAFETFAEKLRTGELPLFTPVSEFEADPLNAPLPDTLSLADPALWLGAVAELLHTKVLSAFPELPVEPSPDPLLLESFTEQWTTADIERMVAEAKVAAK